MCLKLFKSKTKMFVAFEYAQHDKNGLCISILPLIFRLLHITSIHIYHQHEHHANHLDASDAWQMFVWCLVCKMCYFSSAKCFPFPCSNGIYVFLGWRRRWWWWWQWQWWRCCCGIFFPFSAFATESNHISLALLSLTHTHTHALFIVTRLPELLWMYVFCTYYYVLHGLLPFVNAIQNFGNIEIQCTPKWMTVDKTIFNIMGNLSQHQFMNMRMRIGVPFKCWCVCVFRRICLNKGKADTKWWDVGTPYT